MLQKYFSSIPLFGFAQFVLVLVVSAFSGDVITSPARQFGLGALTAAAISPDGKTIASAAADGTIRLWDRMAARVVTERKFHEGSISSIAFSRDGKLLASSGRQDQTIRVWNFAADTFVTIIKLGTVAFTVEFTLLDVEIVAACQDKTAKLFNVKSGDSVKILKGHTSAVLSANCAENSFDIATCSYDSTARSWYSGSLRRTMKAYDMREVFSVDLSADANKILTNSNDRRVRIWNTTTGDTVKTFKSSVFGVQAKFAYDEKSFLVYSTDDSRMTSIDIATGDSILGYPPSSSGVEEVVHVDKGERIFTAGRTDMRILNAKTAAVEQVFFGHSDYTGGIAWSNDGSRVFVSGIGDVTPKFLTRVYNAENNDTLFCLLGHQNYVGTIAVSADGAKVATGSNDGTVRIYDATNGTFFRALPEHNANVLISHVTFNSDASKLVTFYRGSVIRIWNPETGDSLGIISVNGNIRTGKISPDGSSALVVSSTCDIFSLSTFDTLLKIRPSTGITAAAYSPDGYTIITGSKNKLTIRDAQTGDSIGAIGNCISGIVDMNFSKDGAKLFVRAADTLQVFSMQTMTQMGMIRTRCVNACFSPDGNSILTSTIREGIAAVWDISELTPSSITGPVRQPRADAGFTVESHGRQLRIVPGNSTTSPEMKIFRLYTLCGKCVVEAVLPEARRQCISLNPRVAEGMYLYAIIDGEKRSFTGKVLVR